MSRSLVLTLLLVAIALFSSSMVASATFVRIESANPVCFVEDVSAASEIVVVEYKRASHANTNHIPVQMKGTSPYSKSVVLTGKLRVGEASITFNPVSTESGDYELCLSVSAADGAHLVATKSFIDVGIIIDHHARRVGLSRPEPDITRTRVGGKAANSVVMQFTDRDGNQMETLRSVEFIQRVNDLLENIRHSVDDIDTEVEYITTRGTRMRITSESLFSRVWTFALLTLLAMAAVGYMQYNFLTSFLKRKKLV